MENGKWKWIVRNSSNHSHHEADGDHFNFNWNGAIHATGNTHSIRICVKSYFVWCCLWFFKKIIKLYSCDTYFIYSILIMMEKKDHMNWFSLDFWLHLVWHRQTQIHICIQYRLTVFSITEITVEILIGWCNQFLFHTICIQSLFFCYLKNSGIAIGIGGIGVENIGVHTLFDMICHWNGYYCFDCWGTTIAKPVAANGSTSSECKRIKVKINGKLVLKET